MLKNIFKFKKTLAIMVVFLLFGIVNETWADELKVSEAGNGYQTAESPANSVQPAEDVIYGERLRTSSAVSAGRASYFYEGMHLGGVIYADHTIVNSSLNSSGISNVPVTFGDDMRIDGEIWRGTSKGTSDNLPLKISDTLVPTMTNINDIGDSSRYWRNGYFSGDVTVGNLIGQGVIHPNNLAVSSAATTGQVLAINAEGNFEWTTIGTSNSNIGDITAVTAGTGLSGGGEDGDVTLRVANDGITSEMIVDGTITRDDLSTDITIGDITAVTAGTGLSGGGTSGDVTLSVDSSTFDDRYVNVTGDDMTGALTINGSTSVNNSMLSVTSTGSNIRGISSTSLTGYGVYGINGATTSTTPPNYRAGVYGETNGTGWNYNGVYGQADNSVGVYGYSHSEDYPGVRGYNAGGGVGIYGHTAAFDHDDFGTYGVYGEADEPSGRGVYGQSDEGIGVYGESITGTGVYGISDRGNAGYFKGNLRVIDGDINQELDYGGAVKAMAYVVSNGCDHPPGGAAVSQQFSSQPGRTIYCNRIAKGLVDVDFNFDISTRYIQVTVYDTTEYNSGASLHAIIDNTTAQVYTYTSDTGNADNKNFYIVVF